MSVNIFVCCHKDFDFQGITNPGFKIISDKDIKNNNKSIGLIKSDGFLDNRMWSELTQIYYVWKHKELQTDYIGFAHYRRFFDFKNDFPQFDKPIIPKHLVNPFNNYMQYDICHNTGDLIKLMGIIQRKYPSYYVSFINMLDSHCYYPYNMFVLSKELFNKYCEFVFDTLLEFDKIIGVNNNYINMITHIGKYKEKYVEKSGFPLNDYAYQARLYGFLAERLTTTFFFKYMKDNGPDSVIERQVLTTEKTYNQVNEVVW
jgi:hypothetical protein